MEKTNLYICSYRKSGTGNLIESVVIAASNPNEARELSTEVLSMTSGNWTFENATPILAFIVQNEETGKVVPIATHGESAEATV